MYLCKRTVSFPGENLWSGRKGNNSFFFPGRAINLLPFLLIDLPFESCICSQELKKQSMRGETMEEKKKKVELIK